MVERTKPNITITLEQAHLDWIDANIKTKRFSSRSHAIQYVLENWIEQESD